jgi:flagellar basal-body rod protein FlgB
MDPIGRNGHLITLLMDAAVARQRVIARNVANAETPGYRAQDVRFSRDLREAMARGGPDSLGDVAIETFEKDGPTKPDGNSVDLDRELSDLSGNALAYQALVTLVAMKTTQMRSAIAGRSL